MTWLTKRAAAVFATSRLLTTISGAPRVGPWRGRDSID